MRVKKSGLLRAGQGAVKRARGLVDRNASPFWFSHSLCETWMDYYFSDRVGIFAVFA